jgi:hypothetical protein
MAIGKEVYENFNMGKARRYSKLAVFFALDKYSDITRTNYSKLWMINDTVKNFFHSSNFKL